MKINRILFAAIAIIGLLIMSCDEIDPPYLEGGSNVNIDTNKKNVLIEYHTGIKCGNCPDAAKEGKRLVDIYDDKVIMIANHVGSFSIPNQSGDKYTTDYRCEVGQQLDEFYEIGSIGTPMGLINRMDYQGETQLVWSKWDAAVSAELEKTANVLIEMNNSYDEETGTITADATIKYFRESDIPHYFVVYIVEDGIIDYQKWYGHEPEDIPDYHHPNTLRSAMNGSWGDELDSFSQQSGDEIDVSLEYTIPQDVDWIVENINLVAVVYKDDDTRSIENVIMQPLISE